MMKADDKKGDAAASIATVAAAALIDGKGREKGLAGGMPPTAQPASGFHMIYSGQVEAVDGVDTGLSQMAYASNQQDEIIFSFPIDISFKSTNPFGWPRIVLSVCGLDALGRDVIRGYGSIHLPTCAGSTTRDVPLFKSLSSSMLQQFTAWLTGSPPEVE
ncbi:B9 domain-containing protein 1, partial [Globisporangium splendens]